jgi:hypothetical protein
VNAVLWLVHLAVLWFSLPVLRAWWKGSGSFSDRPRRWLVVLSVGMPPVAAAWLVPCALRERHYLAEARRAQERAQALVRHREDVEYWRLQAAQGDPVARQNAADLLEMWRAHAVEPQRVPGPRALPGAHPYSHGCDCRNCVRARRRTEPGLPPKPPRQRAAAATKEAVAAHLFSPDCHCVSCSVATSFVAEFEQSREEYGHLVRRLGSP